MGERVDGKGEEIGREFLFFLIGWREGGKGDERIF